MSVKVGVAGAGGISHAHIQGYRHAGAEVVAVCDPDNARAQWTADQFGIGRTYESLETMLHGEPDLQAVSICAPNHVHAPLAVEAARAGKHVYCEKPPAMNAAEAREMAEAAGAAGVCLMYGFNHRARPEALALKRYIDDGTTGRINSVQAAWVRRCGIPCYRGWFARKAQSGGGPAMDLLHVLDLALWFMSYPDPAWVLGAAFRDFAADPSRAAPWGTPDAGGTRDVETAAHGFVTFATGQVLYARMSWAEMVERDEVSVMFQGARAGGRMRRWFERDGSDETAIDECRLFTHEHGLPVNRNIVFRPDPAQGRLAAVANFVETIAGLAQPLSTPEEGVKLMKIIDALYRSAELNAPVAVRNF